MSSDMYIRMLNWEFVLSRESRPQTTASGLRPAGEPKLRHGETNGDGLENELIGWAALI